LERTITNENCIYKEIESRLTLGGPCYNAKQYVKIKTYSTIILYFVLYGCETWSSTLKEVQRLRVFENRVLRRIFGPKRDKMTQGWIRLHNDEHQNLQSSPNIISMIKLRMYRWAVYVARMT
jgi:hypothetical protein